MPRKNLPVVYAPPVDDAVSLAADVLTIAMRSPEDAALLTRVARALLTGSAAAPRPANIVNALRLERPARAKRATSQPKSGSRAVAVREAAGGTSPVAVDVVTTAANESITFAGKTMELTAKQAALAQLLARGMPNPIGRDFLQQKLFAHRSGNSAEVAVNQLVRELGEAVAGIGLEVHGVRGVGVVLRPRES